MHAEQSGTLNQMEWRSRACVEVAHVQFAREPDRIGYRGPWESLLYLEAVPGSYYRDELLIIPATRPTFQLVELVGRVEEASDGYLDARRRFLAPPEGLAALYPVPPAGQPLPMAHQVEAFAWALDAFQNGFRGFANWSSMGLGKSRMATDLMRHLVKRVSVVITQKICVGQWEETIENVWPECTGISLLGSLDSRRETIRTVRDRLKNHPDEAPICFITNWESITHLWQLFLLFKGVDCVTFDESTRMKNKDAAMSRAARQLSKVSERRLLLSGTPLGNHPGDLWAQYSAIDPGLFGKSYWDFMERYCRLGGTTGWEYQELRSENVSELVAKVTSCSYRATKATVSDLPKKLYRRVAIDPTLKQKELYKAIAEEMFAQMELADGSWATLQVGSAMAKLLRLQQLTAGIFPHTLDVTAPHVATAESGSQAYELVPSAKTIWVRDFVQQTLATNPAKLIIWTRFRPELAELYHQLVIEGDSPLDNSEVAVIEGSTSSREREKIRRTFNDRKSDLKVLVCQIQAAAYGLDIPVLDMVIYHSSTFSFTDRMQSEDRGDRLGRDKTRPYEIIDPYLKGTVDEYILQTIEKKRDLSDLLVTGGKLHEAIFGMRPGIAQTVAAR